MALIVEDKKKIYEKPNSGSFVGVLADVVDLGPKTTQWGVKNKIRFVWLLGKPDGSGYANDSEGNPYRAMTSFNATMNEGGDLFKAIRQILGAAPPVPYDVEQLIGQSNLLFVVTEEDSKKPGTFYANIKGYLPLGNVPALKIPANFVRNKDKKDNRAPGGAAAQQAQAPATPAASVSPISANLTGVAVAGQAPKADVVLDEKF
jgi:hypothetical protein